MKYVFETRMMVRDYECDIEGIVNNANYLHYTEHTRHLFLKSCGLSFADMHRKGIDAVVARMNMQFKIPCVATTSSSRDWRSARKAYATCSTKTSSALPTSGSVSAAPSSWCVLSTDVSAKVQNMMPPSPHTWNLNIFR